MAIIAPTTVSAIKVLGDFIANLLPAGVEVFQAQTNRVPEPATSDFVTMTQTRFMRLATNIDDDADVVFTGSCSGVNLTITDITSGVVAAGATLFGVDVMLNTTIGDQQSGDPGGIGVYTVSLAQTFGSETLSTGAKTLLQKTELTVQIDVHGPNSADYSQIITTAFRDEVATEYFADATDDLLITPLYANEARQLPFTNEEDQVENRWVIELVMQIDQTITAPQQYADAISVDLVEIDSTFPPSP